MNKTVFNYTGEVNLQLLIGDKVINISSHNSGTDDLMKSFAKFLAGYSSTALIPKYLGLEYSDDGAETWTNCLAYEVPLSEKVYDEVKNSSYDAYTANFTGVISYAYLTKTITADSDDKYRLYLYDKDSYGIIRPLAYLSVSAESLSSISPGTQAIVKWSMYVKNSSER